MSTVLYYTHNAKPRDYMLRVYNRHRAQCDRMGLRFVAVVREALGPGDIVVPFDPIPTYADIYRRILRGLAEIGDPREPVYLAEDDCLYTDDHFKQSARPGFEVAYNLKLAYACSAGYFWHARGAIALSQLCGSAEAMRYNCAAKLAEIEARQMACVEPAQCTGKPYRTGTFVTATPNVDLRTQYNATWRVPAGVEFLTDLPGWLNHADLWAKYGPTQEEA